MSEQGKFAVLVLDENGRVICYSKAAEIVVEVKYVDGTDE